MRMSGKTDGSAANGGASSFVADGCMSLKAGDLKIRGLGQSLRQKTSEHCVERFGPVSVKMAEKCETF